jgi:hypothetical protein
MSIKFLTAWLLSLALGAQAQLSPGIPAGPESMVEVKTKTPVKYSLEPVTVEGKFAVLNDDSYGLYYRITDAVSVK